MALSELLLLPSSHNMLSRQAIGDTADPALAKNFM